MNEILNREKFREIDRLLEDEYVMVQVDPTCDGVDIPKHLRHSPSVTLQISRLFRGSMEMDEQRIEAHLLFSGSYYCCILPYEAIWAAVSAGGDEKLWPSSIPKELAKQLSKKKKESSEEDAEKSSPQQPHLTSTKSDGSSEEDSSPPPKRGRPQLKLVKG